LQKLAKPFVVLVEKFYPDPFVFAILLSLVVFGAALGLTDAGPAQVVDAWGNGLASLMAFIGQLSFTLVGSHALAHTDAVRNALTRIGKMPNTARSAYLLVTFVTALASLLAWAFGLVVGALVARQVAIQAKAKGLRLHYALLVAAAYSGFVVWHMGYSSSAALFVATPGHALEELAGGVIPVSQTIFASWNLITIAVTVVLLPFVMAALRPKNQEEIVEIPQEAIDDYERSMAAMDAELGVSGKILASDGGGFRSTGVPGKATVAQKLENARWINLIIGLILVAYLSRHFIDKGLDLNLNIVNWTFLAAGLLLARSPLHYVKLIGNASLTVGQIILQYPFYAGIMGMMIGTGLVSVIADWFISISSAATLGFWAFLSGGIVNYFIPSGGGQWSVQGPIFLEAARTLGTDPSVIVMGVAYGDQWTNMIQPFWTIPILAIAGLHMRQIMGYTFIALFFTFFTFGGGILLAGAG
jgi:short-chain fatty acids transporter